MNVIVGHREKDGTKIIVCAPTEEIAHDLIKKARGVTRMFHCQNTVTYGFDENGKKCWWNDFGFNLEENP